MQKRSLGAFLHARDLAARDVIERLPKPSVMTPRCAGGIEHLVVEDGVDLVTGEKTLTVHRITAVGRWHRRFSLRGCPS